MLRQLVLDTAIDDDPFEQARGEIIARVEDEELDDEEIGAGPWRALFAGTAFGEHPPVPSIDVLRSLSATTARAFRSSMYLPERMAVIVAGGLGADVVQEAVSAAFGDLAGSGAPLEVETPPALFPRGIERFVEAPSDEGSELCIVEPLPSWPPRSVADWHAKLLDELLRTLLHGHLQSGSMLPRRHDFGFGVGIRRLAPGRYARLSEISLLDEAAEDQLAAFLRALRDLRENGFSAAEWRFARGWALRGPRKHADWLTLQSSAVPADSALDDHYSGRPECEALRHFLDGGVSVPAAEQTALAEALLPTVTMAEVQATVPDLQHAPCLVHLTRAADDPRTTTLAQLVDAVANEPLPPPLLPDDPGPILARIPTPGEITARKRWPTVGVTEWQLSNVAVVLLKPMTNAGRSLELYAAARGGFGALPDELVMPARLFGSLSAIAGYGALRYEQLQQALAGVDAMVLQLVKRHESLVFGDLDLYEPEPALQVLHQAFRDRGLDPETFAARHRDTLGMYSLAEQPLVETAMYTGDEGDVHWNRGHVVTRWPSPADVERITLAKLQQVHAHCFRDAGSFVFALVGPLDEAVLEPLVRRYIASLPRGTGERAGESRGPSLPTGQTERTIFAPDADVAAVRILFHGERAFDSADKHHLEALGRVVERHLKRRLSIRGGGEPTISAAGIFTRRPTPAWRLDVCLQCERAQARKLAKQVLAELDALKVGDVSAQDVEAVKRTWRLGGPIFHSGWARELVHARLDGGELDEIMDGDRYVPSVTTDDLVRTAQWAMAPTNRFVGFVLPGKERAE